MGEEKSPCKVKLFFGLLFPDEEILARTEKRIVNDYGDIDLRSPIVPFNKTTYYENEMGQSLLRRFISIVNLIDPVELPTIKIQTNLLEKLFARPEGSRQVNIDPGYLTFSKVILATTKDYTHRLYLGKKIYGEVTLHYKGGESLTLHSFSDGAKSFCPWEWTYPDYREPVAINFFNELRNIYKRQLKREE